MEPKTSQGLRGQKRPASFPQTMGTVSTQRGNYPRSGWAKSGAVLTYCFSLYGSPNRTAVPISGLDRSFMAERHGWCANIGALPRRNRFAHISKQQI